MNNRQRMYASNVKAREYILKELHCDHVYFKEHLRRKSKFYTISAADGIGYYQATDFFNLFDGLCFHDGSLCFFQIKTNAWPARRSILEFLSNKHGFGVFAINVRPNKDPKIKVRWYTNVMYCM